MTSRVRTCLTTQDSIPMSFTRRQEVVGKDATGTWQNWQSQSSSHPACTACLEAPSLLQPTDGLTSGLKAPTPAPAGTPKQKHLPAPWPSAQTSSSLLQISKGFCVIHSFIYSSEHETMGHLCRYHFGLGPREALLGFSHHNCSLWPRVAGQRDRSARAPAGQRPLPALLMPTVGGQEGTPENLMGQGKAGSGRYHRGGSCRAQSGMGLLTLCRHRSLGSPPLEAAT